MAWESAFYLYPTPGPGTPVVLSLGECVTTYAERSDMEAADAVTMTGVSQRTIGRTRKRITISLETMIGGADLGWKLLMLQSHLDRGGRVGFTADVNKSWAAFLTTTYAAGDTTLQPGVPPWSSMVGIGKVLAAADMIRLTSGYPEVTEEAVKVLTWNGASPINLDTASYPPPRFNPTEAVLASWAYFWPVLLRPADRVGQNITAIDLGHVWSLSLELATDPATTWEANQEGEQLNATGEGGGRTLDTLGAPMRDEDPVLNADPMMGG
ncbi:MAG: hypothetical protein ACI8RZ_007980 [Myxococcota bacterium]|jgi:hypothetical protein